MEGHIIRKMLRLVVILYILMPAKAQDSEFRLSLEGGLDKYHGRLTIHWHTDTGCVCNRNIDFKTAETLCRLIGYNGTDVAVVGYRQIVDNPLEVFMGNVKCAGNEDSFFYCQLDYVNITCSDSGLLGLRCGPLKDVSSQETTSKEPTTTTQTAKPTTETTTTTITPTTTATTSPTTIPTTTSTTTASPPTKTLSTTMETTIPAPQTTSSTTTTTATTASTSTASTQAETETTTTTTTPTTTATTSPTTIPTTTSTTTASPTTKTLSTTMETTIPAPQTTSSTTTTTATTASTSTASTQVKYSNNLFIAEVGRRGIYTLSLAGGQQTLVPGTHAPDFWPIALTYNENADVLYYSDHGKLTATIVRFDLKTMEKQSVVIQDQVASVIEGMAFDPISNLLFFTDMKAGSIHAITADLKWHRVILRSNITGPRGIAIHPIKGLMFWTNIGSNPHIGRATLAGTFRSYIITRRIQKPQAIAVDALADVVYWYDSAWQTIELTDLTGFFRSTVYKTSQFLYDFAVDESYLYMSTWEGNRTTPFPMHRSRKHVAQKLEPLGFSYPSFRQNGLALNNATLSRKIKDLTAMNGCADRNNPCKNIPFCLPLGSTLARCHCPHGYVPDAEQNCQRNYTLYLDSGPNPYSGRVIIDYLGSPGTICQRTSYGTAEARVICRGLGLRWSNASIKYYSGKTSRNFWLDRLNCTGDESEPIACVHSPWGIVHPDCAVAVGVKCGEPDFHVKLVDGPDALHGRVQLDTYGRVGTICDDDFGKVDAKVICQMLGYTGPESEISLHFYGPGKGEILLDEVNCKGEEKNIGDCVHSGIASHDCSHEEDVGIHCGKLDLDIKLVGGPDPLHGRVVLSVGGKEGTVCDLGDVNVARVYCRMLNYAGADVSIQSYDAGSGQTWLELILCTGQESSIDQCQYHGWGYLDRGCHHDLDLGINCGTPSDLSVRLVDGPDYLHGRVEVSNWGRVGSVCRDDFDVNDARVVCRMLGYNAGYSVRVNTNYPHGPGDTFIWLDDLQCGGEETNLGYCVHDGWGYHDCTHLEDVGVDCGPLLKPNVRFVRDGKPDPSFGTVVVSDGRVEETLCYLSVNLETARVICRMAGYNGPHVSIQNYSMSNFPISTYAYDCSGEEANLNRCQRLRVRKCETPIPAGVNCGLAGNLTVRLEGGISRFHGRIQLTYQGQEMTICQQALSTSTAEVVCRMVGYAGPSTDIKTKNYGPGSGSIIETINCAGNETTLQHCDSIHWNYNFNVCTSHENDVGLQCGPEPTPSVQARLEGGFDHLHGRVILTVNGKDGTICDRYTGFGKDQRAVAAVICKMLGYQGDDVEAWKMEKGTLNGSLVHWLDGPRCLGGKDIRDCNHNGWGVQNFPVYCDHNHDLAVNCGDVPDDRISLALVDGWDGLHGRVAVNYQGIIGSICSGDIRMNEARVICRMAGYSGTDVSVSTIYPDGDGPVLLDDLKCVGNVSTIGSCSHRGWGLSLLKCANWGHAGVNCGPVTRPKMTVELLGGKDRLHGRVTLFINGSRFNGSICDTRPLRFSHQNIAKVICRSLGYMKSDIETWFCPADSRFLVRDIDCTGSEKDINDCLFPWVVTDERTSSFKCSLDSRHLCVSCGTSNDDYRVWTLRGLDHLNGQVVVSYQGSMNGTICAAGFGNSEAQVVCRMLGYDGSGAIATKKYGRTLTMPIVLGGLSCSGKEQHLGDCAHSGVAFYDLKTCPGRFTRNVGVECGSLGGPITLRGAETCGYRAIQKIAGGSIATRGSWPWQISLKNARGNNICGGSIIAPEWVVTAAHCFRPRLTENHQRPTKVRVGAINVFRHEGQELAISKVIQHPLFADRPPRVNVSDPTDIALVKLSQALTFNAEVAPVCLGAERDIIPKGPCYVTGWGQFHPGFNPPEILRQVVMPVVNDSICTDAFGRLFNTTTNLCAGYRSDRGNVCAGDSGGPLVCQREGSSVYDLYGTVIGGFQCGSKGTPDHSIFSKVSAFTKWIEHTVNNN